ncbi:MAG: AAA family ATPase [Schleiferilactobacillus harbinensis]|jgi:broad-specificity NMP kinase|nr:AAA family ATPase [Schleiferilactobacillus harbinensis]MCI1913455.1 AAA family ATPase [Schleiferilactobacillus harbinensis]
MTGLIVMEKTLYFIGGPMGAGKTAVSKVLLQQLPNAVMLDGDWCWAMDPFVVNEQTKTMVIGNIHHLLNAFIAEPDLKNIIFCWVMDEQTIIDTVLAGLTLENVALVNISLVPSVTKLTENITADVQNGIRTAEAIPAAIARLPKFATVDSIKLDTTHLSPLETAGKIRQLSTEQ